MASQWPCKRLARCQLVVAVLLAAGGLARGQVGAESATVLDVVLERRDDRERVVVVLSRPAPFRVAHASDDTARLEVLGATLGSTAPAKLQADRNAAVQAVRVKGLADRVLIEARRAKGAGATAIREGNRIVWLFAPPAGADRLALQRSRTLAGKRPLVPVEVGAEQVAAFFGDKPLQIIGSRGRKRYTGRRIDLDFKDADIHNLLRLISEVGNVNVVTSDEVQGSVTIRMRNVPWDQALDVILQAKGLGMVRRANLLRVAPMTTLEKERELAIARKKQQIELAPLETRLVPVSYAQGADLAARTKELLTDRGRVSVDERTNMLVVRDIPEALDEIEELVRNLDTQTPQVLIEARIVEATSQFERELGIQWGGDVTMTSATGNPTGLVFPSNLTLAGGSTDEQTLSGGMSPFLPKVPTPNFAINMPATTGTGRGGAIGLSLGSVAGNVNINVRLSAAESSGVVRIISNPRILTLDNHQAHIAQGTSIPYSQLSAQGVQTAFQEAKLELEVTPHVTSDGAIAMAAKVTRDEPDFTRTSARGDPTILKREAETHLLVQDGHTAVIGGIYTRNTGRNVDQVPFFGDIPIIGVLFQHRRMTDQRTELLIFLTPRIVNRAEALRR
ncbi:MAG: type IV pilus secretin PilQ [Proteobacteria bacterium]|nr:type IV pilus secretin PilQ [Pseudomonadota bacterium]